jgi:hypothetical protein
MELSLNPRRVAATMLAIITVLAALHILQLVIFFQVGDPDKFDFIELIDFDYEANFPSFYSSAAILFCAALLWLISLYKRKQEQPFRFHWLGLAIIFSLLGLDEAISLHEELGDLTEQLELFDAHGYLYFAWVVPYAIALTLFALSYLQFVLALPLATKRLFIVSGVLFVSGAMGIELISANEADINGTDTVFYSALYTVEELCEMIGIVIFCYALMRYMEMEQTRFTFRIQSSAE